MRLPRRQSPASRHSRGSEAGRVRVAIPAGAAVLRIPAMAPSAHRRRCERTGIESPGQLSRTRRVLLCLGALVFWTSAAASQLSGDAVVVSGDTLEVAGQRVRLRGIDAPGLGQICRRSTGIEWRCGLLAKLELARHVDGRSVVCEGEGSDEFGQRVATCIVDSEELGAWLVERGWALAAGKEHGAAEDVAREAGRGLWHDSFTPPADWRLAATLPHRAEDGEALDACACTARRKSFSRSVKP